MKIHDKYVIELAEVIKGFGNDYQVKEPFNLPCDYKFYEISGVAICEESFKKMKPLNDEINAVLKQIKAEIQAIIDEERTGNGNINKGVVIGLQMTLDIIDKYRAESEEIK